MIKGRDKKSRGSTSYQSPFPFLLIQCIIIFFFLNLVLTMLQPNRRANRKKKAPVPCASFESPAGSNASLNNNLAETPTTEARKEVSVMIDANTSLKLTPMLLNGKNYQLWSKGAIISLRGKGKFGYVNGEKKKPDKNSEEWEIHDNLVMSWLLNSMEPQISELFMIGAETSTKLWTAIHKMYGKQNNFAHIFQIKQDITQIKQNQRSITQYFGAMKAKWDELDIHQPEITDLQKLKERKDQDRIFQFLANLDPSYEQVRTQILFGANLPPLESIVATLEQEESRRSAMNTDTQFGDQPEGQAFGAFTKNPNSHKGKNQENSNEKCDNCKKMGHTRERCWFLYPHLHPKAWKGGDNQNREKIKGEDEERPRGYAVQGTGSGSEKNGPGEPSSSHEASDSMRQLMEQFTAMLAKQNSNTCGSNNRDDDW
ncbi:uncharacterized protein LOC144562057 [Carex rostrata]